MDFTKPLPSGDTDYSKFRKYEVSAKASPLNSWDFILSVTVDTYSGYSSILPALASMLKVFFNSGLEKKLLEPSELLSLREAIAGLEKARTYESIDDPSGSGREEIEDALLYVAINWARLWL